MQEIMFVIQENRFDIGVFLTVNLEANYLGRCHNGVFLLLFFVLHFSYWKLFENICCLEKRRWLTKNLQILVLFFVLLLINGENSLQWTWLKWTNALGCECLVRMHLEFGYNLLHSLEVHMCVSHTQSSCKTHHDVYSSLFLGNYKQTLDK